MVAVQPRKRSYDSAGRRARARRTREEVLRHARRLFLERGFTATTVADVAAAAEVSVPTVYVYFTSKTQLLREAIETAVVGDVDDIPLADRPPMQHVREAATAEEVLRRFVTVVSDIAQRTIDIHRVATTASDADAEIGELLAELERQRLTTATRIATLAAERAGINDPSVVARLGDTIWVITSPFLFRLFVQQRGWSAEAHRDWMADTLLAVLSASRRAAGPM